MQLYLYIAAPCTTKYSLKINILQLKEKHKCKLFFAPPIFFTPCLFFHPIEKLKISCFFLFSVKIIIFVPVLRAERSNAAKPAQLPNRYRLPNFLLFKSYLPTDYKKTIVFHAKRAFYLFIPLTQGPFGIIKIALTIKVHYPVKETWFAEFTHSIVQNKFICVNK